MSTPVHAEIEELHADLSASPYFSKDMAPIGIAGRKWGTWDIAALWISMAACIPTYTLASSMIDGGMHWWQAILTIMLANCIILIPMILNAHAGTRYGIPFPVYCRASFGLLGANIPALLRALVACGWFGIQTWFGGEAIYTIAAVFLPSIKNSPALFTLVHETLQHPAKFMNLAEAACFLIFWLINLAVIYAGINSIRILLNIKAPLLIALGLALLAWAYNAAGGFGPMLTQTSKFDPGQPMAGQFWAFFFPALTGAVGFWATLSLNIPDFSRYAKSQKSQILGQAIGLPTTMTLYAFIGVAVTSATMVIFKNPDGSLGPPIWDPVVLSSKFTSPTTLVFSGIILCVATLATNIAANVVSPANDFAHLAPRFISFRTGGLITALIGIAMQPWKLASDPTGYIFTWLVAYSSLLGAVGGVLIADYYLIRKTRLDLAGLYSKNGPYWYSAGFNPRAVIALFLGIVPCFPGFVNAVAGNNVFPEVFNTLYNYACFISFGIAMVLYVALMKALPPPKNSPTSP